MKEVWVLMDRKKRSATLLYLCAFPSAQAAINYAEECGKGPLGYSVCGLKVYPDGETQP